MIGALLGHTQAQTTLRYAHLASDHLRKAAEEISAKIASVAEEALAPPPAPPTPPALPMDGKPMLRLVK